MSTNSALASAFADDWEWECLDNPEFASQAGAHDVKWPADGALQVRDRMIHPIILFSTLGCADFACDSM